MKKILMVVILFFCFYGYVNAETFYGEYRLVDDYGDYIGDMLKIDKVKLYNTYTIKYIDMGYMLENNEYIRDENDFIEEYVIVNENEAGDEYIRINPNNTSSYSIGFKNFDSFMKIYEVEVYFRDSKLYFGFNSSLSNDVFNLIDNNLFTYFDCSINPNFYLNLYDKYDLKDITIIIYTDDDFNSEFLLTYGNNSKYITLHNKNKHIITFDGDMLDTKYEYKGFKRLYKYYKEEQLVLNNYVENGENLLLDDYIEFDNYYVRDKLVLDDIMIITNSDMKIEDFIKFSSDIVDIDCNINYNVNGKYLCEFKLNDILVKRNIIINIPNIEESDKNKETNTKEIDIIDYVIENSELNELNNFRKADKVILNNVSDKKLVSKINNNKNGLIKYFKYIIIFCLLIIKIIIFIKKNKK